MIDNEQYKLGDVANGHVLTEQGWMPLATAATTTGDPKEPRRGLKILGIGAAGLLGLVVVGGALGGGEGATGSTDSSSSSSTEASANGDKADGSIEGGDELAAGIGDEVRDGKFSFTVLEVEGGASTYGDGFLTEDAQGEFTIVTIRVENIGEAAQMFTASNVQGIDSKGRMLEAETGFGDAFLEDINPGNSVTAEVAFDVAKDVSLDGIVVHDSMFSDGATIALL